MKKYTFNISTLSVLCVLCAGLTTNAMAAGTVRSLGGANTYDGTSAASTATRTTPSTRAGTLRISPSTARMVSPSTTAAESNPASAGTTSTSTRAAGAGQRLSIGKYLGSSVTTAASTNASNAATSASVSTLEERVDDHEDEIVVIRNMLGDAGTNTQTIVERITELEDRPIISDGDIIKIDGDNNVYIDVDELKDQLVAKGVAAPDMIIDYNPTSHVLSWTDAEHESPQTILDVDDLVTVETFTELQSQVTTITNAVADLSTRMDTAEGNITTLQTSVAAITGTEGAESGFVTNDALTTTLGNYALAANIPTNVSDLTNDVPYATQEQLTELGTTVVSNTGKINTLETTVATLSGDGATSVAGQIETALQDYTKSADLATVATSGSYNDLSNKPIEPYTGDEYEVVWGYVNGVGQYIKVVNANGE